MGFRLTRKKSPRSIKPSSTAHQVVECALQGRKFCPLAVERRSYRCRHCSRTKPAPEEVIQRLGCGVRVAHYLGVIQKKGLRPRPLAYSGFEILQLPTVIFP